MKKTKIKKVSNINNLTIDQFNKFYPIGTVVKYYPIRSRADDFIITKTRSKAYEMCGSKMVGLEHGSGGFCFDNIAVSED